MTWNATEIGVALGESINGLNAIIGIAGSMLAIISAYYWLCDRKNARKATLYFPLFLACRGIVEIIEGYDTLGEDCSRSLFASCARTLDEIVYTHGSIIHLKRVDDLSTFLSLKKAIDENLEFIKDKERSWEYLKDRFRSSEFEKVKSCANTLLSRCKEEVKDIKELKEGVYE